VGAGAVGMSFVDTLIHETDATAIIVIGITRRVATGTMLTPSCGCTNPRLFMASIRAPWDRMRWTPTRSMRA
jgi:hypothetical protein